MRLPQGCIQRDKICIVLDTLSASKIRFVLFHPPQFSLSAIVKTLFHYLFDWFHLVFGTDSASVIV